MELNIVLNTVVVNFRPDKELAPEIVADATAEVLHEVIAAGEASGGARAAGGVSRYVESITGNADSSQQVKANFFAYFRLEQRIGVSQNRTIGFETIVVGLLVPPGSLYVEADPFSQKYVRADVEVGPALFHWGQKSLRGRVVLRGEKDASTNCDVDLLAMGESGE